MSKKSKYYPLTALLLNCKKDCITLTFKRIEQEGVVLPPSAYKYSVLWNDGHGGPLSKSWVNAGYHANANMQQAQVTFTKREAWKTNRSIQKSREISTVNFGKLVPTLSAEDIIKYAKNYNSTIQDGVSTRFRSWEHCHKAFAKYLFDKNYTDYLSLHLAWYMASWGMLRNSFLMNYDYKIHRDLIVAISNERFKPLFLTKLPNDDIIDLIFEVEKIIVNTYSKYTKSKISDTFVTKIMLGIFGCVPAYDRYFKTGAKVTNICNPTFNKHSLEQLWNYYIDNIECFEKARIDLSTTSTIDITPMKLIDMGLWQIGKEKDDSQ